MATITILKKRAPQGTRGARALRAQGEIPGVIYGDNIPSRSFAIAETLADKLVREQGTSSLIDVQLEGEAESVKAIIHHIQNNPVTDRMEHLDFYQVRMDKPLHTEIPLEYTGMSEAVKNYDGILVKQVTELPIKCLPAHLIHDVQVDIASLKTFEDVIRVRDLQIPSDIEVELDPDTIIASVSEPRSEAELEALDTHMSDTGVEGVEVISEKKDEKGAEGEASAEAEKTEDAKA